MASVVAVAETTRGFLRIRPPLISTMELSSYKVINIPCALLLPCGRMTLISIALTNF
jgi:hypothetical protein